MKFKILEFATADIAYEVYGKDLNELFKNVAIAMFETITDTKKIEKKEKREINVQSEDLESLIFDWLTKLLVFFDSENLIFSDFDVNVNEKNYKLNAVCYGEKFDPKKHEKRVIVKGISYHKMKIEKNDFWKLRIIFDI